MIVIKYHKVARARFISHIDVLRHITRVIRRMGVEVEYSQGFNPHMLIKLSAPCPLGIGSVAEYMTVQCKGIGKDEFLRLYNECAPTDLTAVSSWEVDKNPNLQGIAVWADYVVQDDSDIDFSDMMDSRELNITYESKGKPITKDVRDMIKRLGYQGDSIHMRLALGIKTLRPDRLLEYINMRYGTSLGTTDIIKTNQYAMVDNRLVDFDKYLDSMERV